MQHIYRITNKINNKMYIGRTNKPDYRWARHKYNMNPKYKNNSAITIALIKYGTDNFIFDIIASCKTIDDAKFLETILIKQYNTFLGAGYNMTKGGDGSIGCKPSEETKIKMSNSKMGTKNGFFGKTHNSEAIDKMTKINIGNKNRVGKKHSEESKQKISKANSGHHISDEGKLAISLAHKDRTWKIINGKRIWMDK